MSDAYDKPFLVNVEGPDDIEEFDTMREAVDRANEINAELVDTVSRGGEHAPHVWAVPWRTKTYLAAFPDGTEAREARPALPDDIDAEAAYQLSKDQNPEWRSGEHVAFIEGWHAKEATDSRIEAWHQVADHPVLAGCYAAEVPLIDSVLARLSELAAMEQTINELAPAPEFQEVTDAGINAARAVITALAPYNMELRPDGSEDWELAAYVSGVQAASDAIPEALRVAREVSRG